MKTNVQLKKNEHPFYRTYLFCLLLMCLSGTFNTLLAQTVPVHIHMKHPIFTVADFKRARATSSKASLSPAPVATGTWTALANLAPNSNVGGMLLLSDGTVLCKSDGGYGYGTIYNRLTPDAWGSYINGTWSSIAPMHYDRLYYSSQVLKDGRVYVAGGEYGDGLNHGEVYDPLTDTWTLTPDPGEGIADANSEILEDGRVLQAMVYGTGLQTAIYDPSTNTYSTGPNTVGYADESAWVKLPDGSILYVDLPYPTDAHTTERYIPATNAWIADAIIPVSLYDPYLLESGGGYLLPDGRAFFLGSTGHTAYYTPSGSALPGSWTAGPDIPNAQGMPDAASAMMVNGKILCAVSPAPTNGTYPKPTAFYEFDYLTNTFTEVNTPVGTATFNSPSYITNMIDLPDGNVLYGDFDSNQYYVYTPNGSPLVAGKPVISGITQKTCTTYTLYGTGFNGISEGACYGDDWQQNTNYPVVRLSAGGKVYYCRTSNWNSTGVMRGNAADSVTVTLPAGLPDTTYSLVVTANGIASDPITVTTGIQTWYYDADGDGYYGNTQQSCTSPGAGWSTTTSGPDCDDNNAAVHTTGQFYVDADGDGYGAGSLQNVCYSGSGVPAGYSTNNTDCDDTDPNTYPGAPEIADGKDNNCNGQIDEGLCTAPEITGVTYINSTHALLYWTKVSTGTSYTVRRYPTGTTKYTTISNRSDTSFEFVNLTPGTDYQAQVKTICGGGTDSSDWSEPFELMTQAQCLSPKKLNVTNITATSATLNWTLPASSAVGFRLDYRTEGSGTWNSKDIPANSKYKLNKLSPSSTYEWRLRTLCSSDTSNWKGGPEFNTSPSTYPDIQNTDASKAEITGIKVMPVPNNGNFIIQMQLPSKETKTTVMLYNSLGVKVWQKELGISKGYLTETANLQNKLANGIYTLVVERDDYRTTTKLIISK